MKERLRTIFAFTSRHFGEPIIKNRMMLVVGIQLVLVAAANLLAFVFRFEGDVPPAYRDRAFMVLPIVLAVYLACFWAFDLFRGLWRYVGLHDLARIVWASIAGTAILYALIRGGMGWVEYPRSVIILTGLLSGGFLGGIRLAVRWMREWLRIAGPTARRVLIVGAGNAGELLVRDLQANPSYNYKPVAFVDDAPVKQKAKIHGVPVLGTIADIKRAAELVEAQEIIVAIPSASPQAMRRILAASESSRLSLKTLPNIKQFLDGSVSVRNVRPLSLEDLLQREPIKTDLQELHPLLEGKRVVVTGAGGSIGSELCRQISRYKPELLVLFERHENSLYALDLELRETFPQVRVLPMIGDTNTAERVAEVFGASAPHLVFHAAAHKHVPLMERNPGEAVRNNILGTRVVVEAALAAGVERFVLISTDKAINPTNVMGATKRIAEYLAETMNQRGRTRFTVVRFGNVLGSNGSVVPLFTEQIRKGGPVTVTHPDIKRYFMTIPESVQLVLQASVMGQGGDVFVLDMGEQIRVADLARNMILLSGHVPDQDIKITYTGLRPGEKLYEELFDHEERVEPTSHEKIKRAVSQTPFGPADLDRHIQALEGMLHAADVAGVACKLREMVPSYKQDGTDAAK
nr:polysaccharide biosynthesis protein [Nitrospirota bacterium]